MELERHLRTETKDIVVVLLVPIDLHEVQAKLNVEIVDVPYDPASDAPPDFLTFITT